MQSKKEEATALRKVENQSLEGHVEEVEGLCHAKRSSPTT